MLNRLFLMGNLTRDPELRYSQAGKEVCTFSIAVNSGYRDRESGEFVDKVDFFPVTVFGSQAVNCNEYLAKGRKVMIEGKLQQNRWKTESGENRSKTSIIGSRVIFLSEKKKNDGDSYEEDISTDENYAEDVDEQELLY
jgi:single-strand DNA-binding protein